MAKTGKFRCGACGRTFAMAAHLGRHNSAVHGARKHGTTSRRLATRSSVALDSRGRLLRELQAGRDELAAQRAAIDSQVTALNQVLATLGGRTARPGPTRAKHSARKPRAGSLRAYIERVLHAHRGPIAVKAVTAAVVKAGCKSRNKELPKTIGKFLRAMPNVVRVGRGVFRMK